jgi:hypothetical protein
MIPLGVCLCRRVAPDDQAAGRQKNFSRFEIFCQQHADYGQTVTD